jgi:hypothetical protein
MTRLQHLSLSYISLRSSLGYARMTTAFCLGNLRTLKLRNCEYVLDFLENLVRVGHDLKLRSFEIVYKRDQTKQDFIFAFLATFKGLQEAYITEVPLDNISRKHITLSSILAHRSSLKRLISDEPVRTLSSREAVEHEIEHSTLLEFIFHLESLKYLAIHRHPSFVVTFVFILPSRSDAVPHSSLLFFFFFFFFANARLTHVRKRH